MRRESEQAAYRHLLSELTTVIREDIGMRDALAVQFADAICSGMARRNPGAYVYVPGVAAEERRAMHAAIAADFNGRNLKEVCRRYGVSRATVYRACTPVAEKK